MQRGVPAFFLISGGGTQPYHSVLDLPQTLDWGGWDDALRPHPRFAAYVPPRRADDAAAGERASACARERSGGAAAWGRHLPGRAWRLGVYTFAETTPDPTTGHTPSAAERLRDLMEEIELADQVGLDVFGVGEHHRPDYAVSAPAVVLAAAAMRTKQIRLTSAVTVLSSADPVRVFQEFATVDALSGGRAEIMAGRGSFTESFPLFGFSLDRYDELFDDRLDLLLRLRASEHVTWQGETRTPLTGQGVYPRPVQDPLPVWVAVGGTPTSAIRAGVLGLPMALAIIGGMPERFKPFAELHRRAAEERGHPRPALSINAHGFIADTSQAAAEIAYPSFAATMNRIGRERGWPPLTREGFEAMRAPHGATFVGSPAEVVDKILLQHEWFGHDRVLLQLSVGTLPHRL